jgi:hypothetical protein
MSEETLCTQLEQLAGTEAPPPRVDIGHALSRGRRRLRWRRAGMSAVPVAAIAVAAFVVSGVIQPWSGRVKSPVTFEASQGSFNPLIQYAAFGWLPGGGKVVGGNFEMADQQLSAGQPSHPGNPNWGLTIYARGRCALSSRQVLQRLAHGHHPALICTTGISSTGVHYGSFGPVTGREPAVNGHLAFNYSGSLAWEYAPGSWAKLYGNHVHPGARVLTKIAEGVRYGVGTKPSVRFPVQLTGLAPDLRVGSLSFRLDDGVMRATEYWLSDRQDRPDDYFAAPDFTMSPATALNRCTDVQNSVSRHRTINGYQVIVSNFTARQGSPAAQELCATDADGLNIYLWTGSGTGVPAAAEIFAHHLRLLGTNPANWTTKPLG